MEKDESAWPTMAAQKSFWDTMMAKPAVRAKIEPYLHFLEIINQTNSAADVILVKQQIIEDNFLKVCTILRILPGCVYSFSNGRACLQQYRQIQKNY